MQPKRPTTTAEAEAFLERWAGRIFISHPKTGRVLSLRELDKLEPHLGAYWRGALAACWATDRIVPIIEDVPTTKGRTLGTFTLPGGSVAVEILRHEDPPPAPPRHRGIVN